MSRSILIMTAVAVEREAVLRGLKDQSRFEVMEAGVGPVAAAVNTTRALVNKSYDLVISTGIGGGFVGQADIGSVVIADEIVAADLGAQTAEGFASLEELGFGASRIAVDQALVRRLYDALLSTELKVHLGQVLTLATVTGTAATASMLLQRFPQAKSEAMEGFGVASAAQSFGIPTIEIRTISNPVGPRDREAWRIKDALHSLEQTYTKLAEVL